jgi:hypothetical protein
LDQEKSGNPDSVALARAGVTGKQGDQIWRIFAHWAIVYFGEFLANFWRIFAHWAVVYFGEFWANFRTLGGCLLWADFLQF